MGKGSWLISVFVFLMSCDCNCSVPLLTLPVVGLQCVDVVFDDGTHLLFNCTFIDCIFYLNVLKGVLASVPTHGFLKTLHINDSLYTI